MKTIPYCWRLFVLGILLSGVAVAACPNGYVTARATITGKGDTEAEAQIDVQNQRSAYYQWRVLVAQIKKQGNKYYAFEKGEYCERK